MIDFYYWPTPNGWKVSIMLEETGLPYTLCPVNIGEGDQFKPEFLAISPNNRMPAIVDHDDAGRAAADIRIGPDPAASRGEVRAFHADHRRGPQGDAWSGCSGRSAISGRWPASSVISSITPKASRARRIMATPHKRYAGEYNRCLGVLERRLRAANISWMRIRSPT